MAATSRTLALDVRGRLPQGQPGVVVVIGEADGKVSVVAAVNDEARARGVSANELVRAVGPLVGGKGGGKDDVAQGGGTDASRIDEALPWSRTEVGEVAERLEAAAYRLGLDPGDARIGVARSDPSGFLATPVETVKRGRGDLARIAELLAESRTATRSGCSRSSSACPARSPAARGRRPRRCGSGPAGWPGPWRRCRCGSPTSD